MGGSYGVIKNKGKLDDLIKLYQKLTNHKEKELKKVTLILI